MPLMPDGPEIPVEGGELEVRAAVEVSYAVEPG